MRKYTIYLAGQISKDIRTYQWRERAIELLGSYDNIEIINPCSSRFNKELVKDAKTFDFWIRQDYVKLLVPKDRNHVKTADILIVDLNWYSKSKPMIGTFFELGWAFDQENTMVIGISKRKNYISTHPFILQSVDIMVKDIDEACKTVLWILD